MKTFTFLFVYRQAAFAQLTRFYGHRHLKWMPVDVDQLAVEMSAYLTGVGISGYHRRVQAEALKYTSHTI